MTLQSQQQVCCCDCQSLDTCCPRSLAFPRKRGSILHLSGPVKPLHVPPRFHHPMIDNRSIAAANVEFESLQAVTSVQLLTIASSHQRKEKKKTKWAVLYEKCEMRLVADGTGVYIDDTSLLPVRYKQALCRTMKLLGIWEQYCEEPFHQQVVVVCPALYIVCRIKYCMDVLGFEGSVKYAMTRGENTVPCILHFHKRAMEKVMQLIFILALNECGNQTTIQRLKMARELADVLNVTAFGTPLEPGQYHVPMNDKDGTIGEVKFVDGWAKKLEKVLPVMFPSLLLKPVQSQFHDWIKNFKDLSEIMTTLGKNDDVTEFEIHCVETKINAWVPKWVDLTGREGMTNYPVFSFLGVYLFSLKYSPAILNILHSFLK
jgi:hypothetical protein